MDDLGLNNWLKETYGHTVDDRPLFRIIWSTGITEKRKSKFIDFYGEIFLREVIEVREVLKYPMAQDRWILERLVPIGEIVKKELMTDEHFVYTDIYVFQDKNGNFLPLSREMTEAAMYLFCKFYLQMTEKERIDFRIASIARRELATKEKIREKLAIDRSPFGFVLE